MLGGETVWGRGEEVAACLPRGEAWPGAGGRRGWWAERMRGAALHRWYFPGTPGASVSSATSGGWS